MKRFPFLVLVSLLLIQVTIAFHLEAQPSGISEALKIARARLSKDGMQAMFPVNSVDPISGQNGQPLFYFIRLSPQGYVVVSANHDLPPVIAYSYDAVDGNEAAFIRFVRTDLEKRLACTGKLPPQMIEKRSGTRNQYLSEQPVWPLFQQWPEPGTTSTGGWLETNWTQSTPYNDLCPMDPVTGNRSVAGCPSVAMAMIVNFHQTTNQVSFTNADDYHHVYAGRNYWIDNDYQTIDFPSFPMLNVNLDTLNSHYLNGQPITKSDKASLVFACGVAARQVYTSSGSGTFGVDQAFDAYQKFSFDEAVLMTDADTSLYTHIAQNIIDTLPVHLAVVDPAWSMGHNLVIDGYNTDDYFHLNFGWGGSYNGWYLLPDEIPYGLTVIEGVIVDIIPSFPVGVPDPMTRDLDLFPNPFAGSITVHYSPGTLSVIRLYTIDGKLTGTYDPNGSLTNIDLSFLLPGIYFLVTEDGNTVIRKKIIKY